MKKYILILLSITVSTFAQTMSDDNFIYTVKPRKAVQVSGLGALSKTDLAQNAVYFDGLGRPVQSTAIAQGGVVRILLLRLNMINLEDR